VWCCVIGRWLTVQARENRGEAYRATGKMDKLNRILYTTTRVLKNKVHRLKEVGRKQIQTLKEQKEATYDKLLAAEGKLEDLYESSKLDLSNSPSSSTPKATTRCDFQRGRPYAVEYERLSREVMSSGMSAQACQHAMELCSKYYLGEAAASKLETPHIDWFTRQREGLGVESWMYAMIRIAGADKILQHGCDETGIDETIIEAGAVLVDGTAEGCGQHIKTSFERGERAVVKCLERLRELYGEEVAQFCLFEGGG